ncbi:MAG: pyridoxamine kinase [Lachnospiraceae bacterium]|jgi:pyridoxine kinase|nr:pyridoxamine kinase [Lachnospiraceae bacterium]
MKNYHQKTIAMVNDLSGYGRCSLTVAMPIVSAMGIQCCPVPTSILSNHTGFPVWFFDDYTDKMERYIEKWNELDLTFDGIATGFLGSQHQIQIVSDMIKRFRKQETKVIVDPIMGDHGKPYSTYTPGMCREMETLVKLADVVTPNVTEACILTGKEYRKEGWKQKELEEMACEIQKMGPSSVVITGVSSAKSLTNVVLEPDGRIVFWRKRRAGNDRPGTGDVFSSIVAGSAVLGWSLSEGVALGAEFVKKCIQKSDALDIPVKNGVCFELLLPELIMGCKKGTKGAFHS